eukprot:8866271-Alexandrium_andersonii.AAC.1
MTCSQPRFPTVGPHGFSQGAADQIILPSLPPNRLRARSDNDDAGERRNPLIDARRGREREPGNGLGGPGRSEEKRL